jgi:hypothetical protein
MNTYELLEQSLKRGGFAVTDANKNLYGPIALRGYNEGYRAWASSHQADLRKWSIVTLSATKTFDLTALNATNETVNTILKVSQYQDFTADAGYAESSPLDFDMVDFDTVVVPQAEPSGTVYVQYRINPADLALPTPTSATGATSPSYMPTQYHDALVFKGIAEIKQSIGEIDTPSGYLFWNNRFNEAIYGTGRVKRQTRIKDVNQY